MARRKDIAIAITLGPDEEQAVRNAIRAGKVTSADEFITRAIASLPKGDETPFVNGLRAGGQPLTPAKSPSGNLPDVLLITRLSPYRKQAPTRYTSKIRSCWSRQL